MPAALSRLQCRMLNALGQRGHTVHQEDDGVAKKLMASTILERAQLVSILYIYE